MKMKSKIDFRIVLKFSPVVGVLLCALLWSAALKKTWESYTTYAKLVQADNESDKLSISPSFTADRAVKVSKLYHKFEVDTLKWKSKLWNHCATLGKKHNVSMRSFPPLEGSLSSKDSILIQKVELSGNYQGLIRLQHALESLADIGKITSLVYQKPIRESDVILTIFLTAVPMNNKSKL
jgi:hypothetical protein